MATFKIKGQAPYEIPAPEKIATPRLLVFQDRVERNIERMRRYLEAVVPNSGFQHLCPHIKTNKSSLIVRYLLDAGIRALKTTMRELKVAIAAGAQDIFISYPLLPHDALRLAHLIESHPNITFSVQIGAIEHASILKRIAEEKNLDWNYFIDIDVGMHRTGIAPEQAMQLFDEISAWHHFKFVGLHGYDGHNHYATSSERREVAEQAMATFVEIYHSFQQATIPVQRAIVAGSPSFRLDFEILSRSISGDTLLQVSPGTWIYWDTKYDAMMPGEFELAALVLAQVIEASANNRITLNLGHKRWSIDQGVVEVFNHPNMNVVSYSEEHTVIEHSPEQTFKVGDYILIAPKHVCSTVNLYEHFTLIGADGQIEIESSPVDGRNR